MSCACDLDMCATTYNQSWVCACAWRRTKKLGLGIANHIIHNILAHNRVRLHGGSTAPAATASLATRQLRSCTPIMNSTGQGSRHARRMYATGTAMSKGQVACRDGIQGEQRKLEARYTKPGGSWCISCRSRVITGSKTGRTRELQSRKSVILSI